MSVKKIAVFTIIQNEDFFLNIWINYYKQFFPNEDIYILNHDSTTETSVKILEEAKKQGINIVPVHRDLSFDHAWLRTTVETFQRYLLQSYDCTIFAEVDEILIPNPEIHKQGLKQYVIDKFTDPALETIKCAGFNVEHDITIESDIDLSKPILGQRSKWRRTFLYDKPLISKVPCRWINGFHDLATLPKPFPMALLISLDLILVHLHKMDYALCKNKHAEQAKRNWSKYDVETLQGDHNRIFDGEKFDSWFFGGNKFQKTENHLINIPEAFKGIV
jgi:hypothetical protein